MKQIKWAELESVEPYFKYKLYGLQERWDDLSSDIQKDRLLHLREQYLERASHILKLVLLMRTEND